MEWKNLRQGKGKSVQIFTEEFRKKALALNIPLYSQEIVLKYIGGLHSYILHTILLFNPTNLDGICVQVTHLESREKDGNDDSSMDPVQQKGSKNKGEKVATVKKEEVNPTCSRCKKEGHDDSHCWKLHPELMPKRFGGKGKKNIVALVQQDLGSNSDDEAQITVVAVQGILSSHASSSSPIPSPNFERTRSEIFHIRVITKHTEVATLFYIGSQVNLIYETIVKKLGC
jgi:hypothetical protein